MKRTIRKPRDEELLAAKYAITVNESRWPMECNDPRVCKARLSTPGRKERTATAAPMMEPIAMDRALTVGELTILCYQFRGEDVDFMGVRGSSARL
jgi:hypothetical protein